MLTDPLEPRAAQPRPEAYLGLLGSGLGADGLCEHSSTFKNSRMLRRLPLLVAAPLLALALLTLLLLQPTPYDLGLGLGFFAAQPRRANDLSAPAVEEQRQGELKEHAELRPDGAELLQESQRPQQLGEREERQGEGEVFSLGRRYLLFWHRHWLAFTLFGRGLLALTLACSALVYPGVSGWTVIFRNESRRAPAMWAWLLAACCACGAPMSLLGPLWACPFLSIAGLKLLCLFVIGTGLLEHMPPWQAGRGAAGHKRSALVSAAFVGALLALMGDDLRLLS